MTDYRNAPQTQLLATSCCCCGRPLVDAISVQLGIGPECRQGYNSDISPETQARCNQLTHRAAVAAQEGSIEAILAIADAIKEMGMTEEELNNYFIDIDKELKTTLDDKN